MAATFDTLAQEALILPPDQRVALAHRLLSSVEEESEPGVEAAWEKEIAQRIARSDAGETQPIPAAQFFASLRHAVAAVHQP